MAFKRFLSSIIFLCFLFTVFCLLVHRPQTSPEETNVPRHDHVSANSTELDWREKIFLRFKPRPDSQRVVIEIDKITKALWDSGFKIMSLLMDRNLLSVIPYADSGSVSGGEGGGGSYKKNNNTITLYNGSKITIFAPVDEAISFKSYFRTNYRFQIVPIKVDKEDFSACVALPSFYREGFDLIITEAYEFHRIHNARITHWNIYNDNNVVVHGVDNSFNHGATIEIFLLASCVGQLSRPLLVEEE
ncbi:hypothetical protein DITRI_Ditri10aG0173100 [Diplodiscus trichospermus]